MPLWERSNLVGGGETMPALRSGHIPTSRHQIAFIFCADDGDVVYGLQSNELTARCNFFKAVGGSQT